MASITAIAIASVHLFPPPPASPPPPPTGVIIVEILAGGVLLLIGGVQWRKRDRARSGVEPSWMKKLHTIGAVLSFVLGAFLPTYALIFPAVQAIEGAHLPKGQAIAAFVVFLVLATLGLIVPIVLYATRPASSEATLERWRAWMLAHQRAVGAVLLFVIGGALVLRAVAGAVT
jgi:hypothetical protein